MKPIVILNLKSYKEGFYDLENIIKAVNNVASEYPNIDFVLAPNALVFSKVATIKNKKFLVYAQHAEALNYGAHTGHIPLPAIKDLGGAGTLINHSEYPLDIETIRNVNKLALDMGLSTVICGGDLEIIRTIAQLGPTYVAFEPPELIGTGRSVSKTKPEILAKSVKIILDESQGKSTPLCGAGISTGDDVKAAFELGARGILVASAFVRAKDRTAKLREFAEAIEEST